MELIPTKSEYIRDKILAKNAQNWSAFVEYVFTSRQRIIAEGTGKEE